MTEIKNLFSFVSTLSGVQRFSLLKQVHKENVLEHTGMVVIFALMIVNKINEGLTKEKQISVAEVLSKAIVHDWDEVVTGDVVRPTKYYSEKMRDEFKSLEQHGISQVAHKLEMDWLRPLHAQCKDGLTGYIVAFADLMAAIHRIWEEVLVSHNHHMVPCANGTRAFLFRLREARPSGPETFEPVLESYHQELCNLLTQVCIIHSEYGDVNAH